jgi:hypothetical protein
MTQYYQRNLDEKNMDSVVAPQIMDRQRQIAKRFGGNYRKARVNYQWKMEVVGIVQPESMTERPIQTKP